MDWQKAYETGNTPWEKGEPHPGMEAFAGLGWFEQWKGSDVLCPGAGLGHDVAFLRQQGVEANGVDISPMAVEMSSHAYPGERNLVVLADFFTLGGRVDGIWEHTCFCAIDPEMRQDYVATSARLLGAGGILQGVFFLNPDHDEPGPPFGVKEEELLEFFAPDFELLEKREGLNTYEGREERELAVRFRRR